MEALNYLLTDFIQLGELSSEEDNIFQKYCGAKLLKFNFTIFFKLSTQKTELNPSLQGTFISTQFCNNHTP